MPIPRYFVLERAKALQEQEKRLGEIIAKLGPQEKEGVSYGQMISNRNLIYLSKNTHVFTSYRK